MSEDRMRKLVVAAGLDVQHTCAGCGVRLSAWGRGRNPEEKWSCPACNLPGATVATIAEASS